MEHQPGVAEARQNVRQRHSLAGASAANRRAIVACAMDPEQDT